MAGCREKRFDGFRQGRSCARGADVKDLELEKGYAPYNTRNKRARCAPHITYAPSSGSTVDSCIGFEISKLLSLEIVAKWRKCAELRVELSTFTALSSPAP